MADNYLKPHAYRWIIVFGGMIGLLASLGIGRFSLGMMLPGMGTGLDLSYSQMGVISTLNFCGYLVAVLFCGKLSALFGPRLLITLGLLLVGGSMVSIGYATEYFLIVLLYCCTGIGSALSNVPIMALISEWFAPEQRGRAAGLCIMGNGLGILLSGRLVPFLENISDNWRMSWHVLGVLALFIGLICFLVIRSNHENGKDPQGEARQTSAHGMKRSSGLDRKNQILHCAALYFLFGFTYVIYITFMVTFLVEEKGMTESAAGSLWSWVGVLSLGSGPVFGYLSDRKGRKTALILVFSIQTIAYLLVGMSLPVVSVYVSIALFAIVAFSVPTIMAALVGDYVGPERAAATFGYITFIFGIGQIGGPALAGFLAELTGTFSTSFLLAGGLGFVAVLLSSRLPKVNR